MGLRPLLLWIPLLAMAVGEPAAASVPGPIVHEPIPPDAREDLAMHVALEGDLPAALQTRSGVVSAPDPQARTSLSDTAYGTSEPTTFQPDRDTKRPEVSAYDEPFTPSTAPFKRLEAFDAVHADYSLYVRDSHLSPLPPGTPPGSDDEAFYADLVVDITPGHDVRIPTVGPGARIVRGHLAVGAVGEDELAFRVMHDSADKWFLQAAPRTQSRGRLVMELAVARATFGGQMGDPSWGELLLVPPLPDNVARDAAQVPAAIGVSRAQRPREAIAKLVHYFREFTVSDDEPLGRGNVYLDLALSKKGVCRHRAFAFLVTAQSMGIPTRMVLNEAHAWVEVHDAALWRRIDLGGAGHMANGASDAIPERAVYQPPVDPFAWPQNASRGDDMVADARSRSGPASGAPGGSSSQPLDPPAPSSPSAAPSSAADAATPPLDRDHDDRPVSTITLSVTEGDAHRGLPLHVRGELHADGEGCPHVPVEIWLRDSKTQRLSLIGTLATGDEGHFAGGLVVPATTLLGEYDVVARTAGDARCGGGSN